MNKKHLLLDYSLAFLLSLIVLLASFFSTKSVASKEAKNNLFYYGEQISQTYHGESDKETTLAAFSKIHSLRVSIFNAEANLVLEINPLDKEPGNQGLMISFRNKHPRGILVPLFDLRSPLLYRGG